MDNQLQRELQRELEAEEKKKYRIYQEQLDKERAAILLLAMKTSLDQRFSKQSKR